MKRFLPKITPRSPDEEHRDATPLELFFDLVFVVAIASASSAFHHALSEGHFMRGIMSFTVIFFAIWWAWMNFTWFSSAYDNDDLAHRLLVFVQMSGALIIAAGVPQAFKAFDFTIMTIGYTVMRIPLVLQWIRVARHDAKRRCTAMRYISCISLAQLLWIALLFVSEQLRLILIPIAIILEIAIPIWAELKEPTPWHQEHIIERYGLFTIIVLGEAVLAASLAIQAVMNGNALDLVSPIVGSLIVLYALWWIYFNQPEHNHLGSLRTGLLWGYGHLFIFGSAAAVGVGIAVVVDFVTHHSHISQTLANLTVTVPVAIFLLSIWAIHVIPKKWNLKMLIIPFFAGLIVLSALLPHTILITGMLLIVTLFSTRCFRKQEHHFGV